MAESRIAKLFRLLRKQGVFAKRNFWCCQTCAWYDVGQQLGDDYDGTVAFMHQQDEECWRETGKGYLAWSGNGQLIAETAKEVGFEVEWDGTEHKRIVVINPDFVDKRLRRW